MEKIILVLHGSPRSEANKVSFLIPLLAKTLNKSFQDIKLSFLQFGSPSLEEVLEEVIKEEPSKVIIHPFFLTKGQHVSSDIPKIIKKYEERYPKIKFFYTPPLGIHPKMAEIVKERIEESLGFTGEKIERLSMEIIEREVDLKFNRIQERELVRRIIHATADPEYKDTMYFHPEAISKAVKALKEGKDLLVDVEMVKAGINKKLLGPSKVVCYLSEIENSETTRSEKAIALALEREKNLGLIAIGNSPTALIKTIEILNLRKEKEIVVIGMPVGFVKALEAKILLYQQDFPFITNFSPKGGSSATVAIINGLLKIKEGIF